VCKHRRRLRLTTHELPCLSDFVPFSDYTALHPHTHTVTPSTDVDGGGLPCDVSVRQLPVSEAILISIYTLRTDRPASNRPYSVGVKNLCSYVYIYIYICMNTYICKCNIDFMSDWLCAVKKHAVVILWYLP
jgi:hypothetical protein